ncbi:MAG: MaoC family dehydratase N-terminal domain-containing protein [Frankiaceae bacterium]|nr:MaoC family dehydratase N-terminal domain-containing protein [Frankiaceae bacterium]MBV9871052.1 MaoC family dehydratase N-terminal domain-containing protein [Frankiaceae bacterium]
MSSEDLLATVRALVGTEGPVQVARHPVNLPAIADWCDAIGDHNPVYSSEAAAAKSVHGGVVAPPATLDIWDRLGLPAQFPEFRTGDDPQSKVLRALEGAGYVGVVAVNSELEIARYLRPGDKVQHVQILEEVSDEKQTALGIGHFITTRSRYTTDRGEHVGDLLFRILKFKPGTGTPAPAAPADKPKPPDAAPELRPRPAINRDNEVLFDGYRKHELRIPKCNGCGVLLFPPTPRCAACGAFDMGYQVASGRGTVYAHVAVNYPQVPGFAYPLSVALIELDEGTRMVSNIVGVTPDQVSIGMRVEVEWADTHPALVEGATDSRGAQTLPMFRPATPERRGETLKAGQVSAEDALPIWVMPVTPTRIVAGALATRDFQDVHHDRDLAHNKGSKDIFLNINTSLGLMQRYVTDWAGSEALVKALRVRLGAPAYPYAPLTFSGSVQSADPESGAVTVAVVARNQLGNHVSGTVELELPR